jgi:hypothetical protein
VTRIDFFFLRRGRRSPESRFRREFGSTGSWGRADDLGPMLWLIFQRLPPIICENIGVFWKPMFRLISAKKSSFCVHKNANFTLP